MNLQIENHAASRTMINELKIINVKSRDLTPASSRAASSQGSGGESSSFFSRHCTCSTHQQVCPLSHTVLPLLEPHSRLSLAKTRLLADCFFSSSFCVAQRLVEARIAGGASSEDTASFPLLAALQELLVDCREG